MVSWLDRRFGRRHALRYLIEAPLRWRWHVLVPAALVLVATMTAGLLRPSRYRAVALVRVEQNAAEDAAMQSRGIDLAERRSRAVSQRVLERAAIERLLQRAEFDPSARVPSPDEVDKWLDIVRVLPQGASAVRIECIQTEATRAALIANLLATDLVEQTAPPDVEPDLMRPQLLEARLAEARRAMEESQAALARLEPTPAAPDAEGSDGPQQQAERSEVQRRAVVAALAAARARASRVKEALVSEGPEAAVARQAAPSLRRELQELQTEISLLSARLATLETGAGHSSRPATPTPTLPPTAVSPKERQRLASEHDRARTAYQALLEQWRAAEMAARLGHGPTARFELLRKATVPDRREPPGLVLLAFAGGALGLALGLAVALLAEARDQTVKGPEDLAKVLPLPLLATIPLVHTGKPAPRRAIPAPAGPRR